jgi:hypothetical protein
VSFLASFFSRSLAKDFIPSSTCMRFEMASIYDGGGVCLLCTRSACWTVVSARLYPRCHGAQITMDSVHPSSLHYSK